MNPIRLILQCTIAFAIAFAAARSLGPSRASASQDKPSATKVKGSLAPVSESAFSRSGATLADEAKQRVMEICKSGRSLEKDSAAIEALSRWAQADYAAALAFAQSLQGKQRNQALAAVLGVLAHTQAEAAWWQVTSEDKTGRETSGMARVFFQVWAGIDRAAAVRFADSHAEVERYFVGSCLLDLHGAHPASLLPIVAQVQRAQLRDDLILTLANESDLSKRPHSALSA